MRLLETCICLLASTLCCSGQGPGGGGRSPGNQHEDDRFTVEVGVTPLNFDKARASCGEKKYLLSLQVEEATMNISHLRATFRQHGLEDSLLWLNLRIIEGFFHWLDPIPRLFERKNNRGYGEIIDSFHLDHGCAVLNASSGAIQTRPCEEQHQFVCIEDKMLQPLDISDDTVSTRLTFNRSPILLSYNLHDLVLTCTTSLGNGTLLRTAAPGSYAYAYVWTKNGVFLNHMHYSLRPGQLSELNVYKYSNESSQGAYRCGLKALPSGNIIWSQVVNVVLEDFNTYLITGDLPKNNTLGPIQFISSHFWSFTRTIGAALSRAMSDASWSYSRITVEKNGAVKLSVFIYTKRSELATEAAGLQAQMFDFNSITSALQNITLNANITDVVHCDPTQQGQFIFSGLSIGFAESSPLCTTDSGHAVPRICNITFRSKPTWAAFDESQCKVTSSRHSELDFNMDEHDLICTNQRCRANLVSGSWHEVWQSCNVMRGFLEAYGQVSWTDLVRKHGYIQSDSTGYPEVMEALRRSELLSPTVLTQPVEPNSCFVRNQLYGNLHAENITQTACTDIHGARCAFRYQRFFRSLNPCPKGGWLDTSNKTTCFWLELSPLNYDRAAERCAASGGRLATLEDTSLAYTIALLILPPDVPRQFDSYWIGLRKTSSGDFEWTNNGRLQHFTWHPRTDYQLSAGTLHVDRYIYGDGLSLRFSLENPRLKMPAICEAPLRTATPWLRIERRDVGTNITLLCRVSAEVLPGSVLWYKDGVAVQGDRANMADGDGTTLVVSGATSDSPYLQGFYWCEGLNVADFRPVASKAVLMRIEGVKTYACSTHLDKPHPELHDFRRAEFLQFAYNFKRDFFYAVVRRNISDFEMHELRVIDVMEDGSGLDILRFLVYFKRIQGRPRTRRYAKDDVDEELRTIDWLNSTLLNSNITLKPAPYVRLRSFTVKSTVMCLSQVTTHNSGRQSTLTWPTTPIGGVATPFETCIQADGRPTVRRCEGNFTVGAYWGDVQGSCESLATQRTLDLRNLSLESVTSETMDPTADRLQELTADSRSLGPQDVVYVATTLENIVSAGSISVQAAHDIASTINHVVRADSQVLEQSRPANSTNRILTAMERASAGLATTGTLVVSGSVALAKVSRREHTSRGVGIHLQTKEIYNLSDPANLTEGTDAAFLLPEHWDTAVPIPGLAVGLIESNALLQEETPSDMTNITSNNTEESSEVCSSILQLKYDSVANIVSTENMSFSFYFKETCGIVPERVVCVFWDVNENRQLGSWSEDGCEYGGKVDEYHVCHCMHLTSFAVLFKYSGNHRTRRAVHDVVLSYLTIIGITVSAVCLFMVVMTYILFKKWRKGVGHQVLFNLCLSLLGALVSFVALVALPKHSASPTSCTCVGAALHYFLLVSFAWTFVEALLQYLRFVRVLGTYVPNLVLKAAFGAWGVPMLVILSVLIINPTQYHKRQDICWLDTEALLYSFLLPVGLILTANVVVFFVVVFSIYCRRQKGLRSTQSQVALAKAQLRATVCIVFLLGLTWIFAYLSLLEEVSNEWGHLFEYLFVITSSLQGLVIFVFHIAYEKTAREFWLGQILYRMWPQSRKRSFDQGSSKMTFSSL